MKGRKQVDINTGTPLSKNKSFSRKGKVRVEFIGDDSKYTSFKNIKQKAAIHFFFFPSSWCILLILA